MSEDHIYYEDINEPEVESIIGMNEIQERVKYIASEAWEDNTNSYKAYLLQFSQLIESYVASTNEQTVRGAIFQYACGYDYHMASEIDKLPDDL